MSLILYMDAPPDELRDKLVRYVRLEFDRVSLRDDEVTSTLLKEIELGEFVSFDTIKDRYGRTLDAADMSESCKAALCAAYMPDKVIDTIGCDPDAIGRIISTLKSGAILLHHPAFIGYVSENIDVLFNGYHYTDGNELSFHIDNEYPYPRGTFLYMG